MQSFEIFMSISAYNCYGLCYHRNAEEKGEQCMNLSSTDVSDNYFSTKSPLKIWCLITSLLDSPRNVSVSPSPAFRCNCKNLIRMQEFANSEAKNKSSFWWYWSSNFIIELPSIIHANFILTKQHFNAIFTA